MKAIILAAGRGTRVRPITNTIPKPMMPIMHKPVLEILVEHLARFGFNEIMVNTSYLAPSIENYFRDGSRFGVQMAYSFEGHYEDDVLIDEPVGSAGAIRRIQEHSGFFDDTFLTICGDAIIDLDLSMMLEFHKEKSAIASLALRNVGIDRVSSFGVAVTDEDNRILEFQEKPKREEAKSTLISTGIYLLEPSVIDSIPSNTTYDIGSQLFPGLINSKQNMYGMDIPFNWWDIGNTTDYYNVFQSVLNGELQGFEFPGKEVMKGVWSGLNVYCPYDLCNIVPPVFISGSATIEPGCTIIGPAYIGQGCHIESNSNIEKSMIFDYTRINSQAHVCNMMVCGNFCIDSTGAVIDLAQSDVDWIIRDSRSLHQHRSEEQDQFLALFQEMQEIRKRDQ